MELNKAHSEGRMDSITWPKRARHLVEFSSPFLERAFARKVKPGRPSYGVVLFQGLLVRQRLGWSYEELEDWTGIDDTTFIKADERFRKKGLFTKLFGYLVKQLLKEKLVDAQYIAADASFVKTYSGKAEVGSGYSGHHEGNGFKLHVLVDTKTELPLALVFSSGNRHDSQFLLPLVAKAKKLNVHPDYVIADKGYDDETLVWAIVQTLQATACIPTRKRTNKGTPSDEVKRIMAIGRSEDKTIYKKRTAVERNFSYLKGKFHLGKERTRGLKQFIVNAFKATLCWLIEKLVKTWNKSYV